jgi:hypothetical protein
MPRHTVLTFILAIAMMVGCGSPEKYKKSDVTPDSSSSQGTISLRLGEQSANWAHGLAGALHGARLRYDTGDTTGAFYTVDSLIVLAKAGLDSIPYGDGRRKVLLLLVTDLYTQAVTWDEMSGKKQDAASRTQDFQALADHLQRQKDSAKTDSL